MLDVSVWRRGLELLTPSERRYLYLLMLFEIVAAVSNAAMVLSVLPFLTVLADPDTIRNVDQLAWLYDRFGFESDYQFLVWLGIASLTIVVAANLIQILRTYGVNRFITMRQHSISSRLLNLYLNQDYSFFLRNNTSNMGAQILHESIYVVQYFFRPVSDVFSAFVGVVAIGAAVLIVNPLVAGAAALILGAFFGLFYLFSSRFLADLGRLRTRMNSARVRVSDDALKGIKNVKTLDIEDVVLKQYDRFSIKMVRSQFHMRLIADVPRYILQILAFGGVIVLCLALLDRASLQDGSALSDLVPLLGVFAFAGQRLIPELSTLYRGISQLRYGQGAVDAIHDDIARLTAPTLHVAAPTTRIPLVQSLAFDDVTYLYPGSDKPGLNRVSFEIRAGEKIGVVGSSGAGKTTLADIVLGLLKPTSGQMIVDGQAVTEDLLSSWRRSVGYVPQDIFLIDTSVAENIALGIRREDIEDERLKQACRLAQIDHIICNELEDGYDTPLGERGLRLSGGQRQRIGIARALYHDSDLIVFDEATSALDTVTEKNVMSSIAGLPGDKTALVIAHRLSTIRNCDRILVLDEGQVAGFDTWDALIENNELFRRLWQHDKS